MRRKLCSSGRVKASHCGAQRAWHRARQRHRAPQRPAPHRPRTHVDLAAVVLLQHEAQRLLAGAGQQAQPKRLLLVRELAEEHCGRGAAGQHRQGAAGTVGTPPAWGWGHHGDQCYGDTNAIGMAPTSWGHSHQGDTVIVMGSPPPYGWGHHHGDTITTMVTPPPPSWGHNHQGDSVTTKGTQSPSWGHRRHHGDTVTMKGTQSPS